MEGNPYDFLIYLRTIIDRYSPYKYNMRLSERAAYNAQCAFMIDHVTRQDIFD